MTTVRSKKVLLLGANGQLGSDVHRLLSSKSELEIIPVYRKQLNVEQLQDIIPFLKQFAHVHVVINCIAFTNTDRCEDETLKATLINDLAVGYLAKFCQEKGILLFHMSTDYVFDGKKQQPYTEEDQPQPLNMYGLSKLAGEQAIQAYHGRYFIFRVSSLFGRSGASGKKGNFIETMLKLHDQSQPLSVIDDQYMSPTHTLDVANAIDRFIRSNEDQYGIYHCSGEGYCSWYEFAQQTFQLLNIDVSITPVSYKDYQTKAKRPQYSVLNNAKLKYKYDLPHWEDALKYYLQLKNYI
jgi:dTDP-4-dehydrorhamnose reductase